MDPDPDLKFNMDPDPVLKVNLDPDSHSDGQRKMFMYILRCPVTVPVLVA